MQRFVLSECFHVVVGHVHPTMLIYVTRSNLEYQCSVANEAFITVTCRYTDSDFFTLIIIFENVEEQ